MTEANETARAPKNPSSGLARRGFLRAAAGVGAVAATLGAEGALKPAVAQIADVKRIKSRFQPDSQEVKTFYRVNSY